MKQNNLKNPKSKNNRVAIEKEKSELLKKKVKLMAEIGKTRDKKILQKLKEELNDLETQIEGLSGSGIQRT